jgi:hypothetical protein
MAWSLVGTGAVVHGNNVASLAVPYPAGLQAGDLLIIQAVSRQSSARDPDSLAGWTDAERRGANGGSVVQFTIATGSESGTLAQTYTGAGATGCSQSARMAAFRGNLATQGSVKSVSINNTFTSSADLGPLTALALAHDDCLLLVGAIRPGSLAGTIATLTGDSQTWNELWEEDGAAGNGVAMVMDYAFLLGQPAITDKTFDHSSGSGPAAGHGYMIAFRPSSTTVTQNVAGTVGIAGAVTTQVSGGTPSQNVAGTVPIVGELVDIAVGLNDGGMEGFVTPVGALIVTLVGEAIELAGDVGITGELDVMAILTLGGTVTPVGTVKIPTVLQSIAGTVAVSGAVASLVIGGPAGSGDDSEGTVVDSITSIGSIT